MKQREILANEPHTTRRLDFDLSERDDIELSFIRTLSVRGLILSGTISAEDRRERIRLAIYNQRLDAAPFDEKMNFAQAYQLCYNRPLDLRRPHRAVPANLADVSAAEEVEEAEEDEGPFDDVESIDLSDI